MKPYVIVHMSTSMSTLHIALVSLVVGCTCANASPPRPDDTSSSTPPAAGAHDRADNAPNQKATRMRIRVGSAVFPATLEANETASAFKAMLPLTLNMADLHANEKHADLARSLPVDASNPRTIHAGDVMLYGSKTLVLFYETFATSYSYTRIGKVDDVSGLAAALRSGSITITFEL
jgi:hypothetical protein